MKISNKFVEVDFPDMNKSAEEMPVTIRFPLTNAEITITGQEARELYRALDVPYSGE